MSCNPCPPSIRQANALDRWASNAYTHTLHKCACTLDDEHGNSRRRISFLLIVSKMFFFPLNFSQPFVTFLKEIPLWNLSVLVLNKQFYSSVLVNISLSHRFCGHFVCGCVHCSIDMFIMSRERRSCENTRQKHLRIRSVSLEHWIVSQDFRLLELWNSSVLHQNEGSIGKSFPDTWWKSRVSREISRAEGMDFLIPPEFSWSTFILSSSRAMYQEILPSEPINIDSDEIHPSLVMMRNEVWFLFQPVFCREMLYLKSSGMRSLFQHPQPPET